MRLKNILTAIILALLFTVVGFIKAEDKVVTGKDIFIEKKCMGCHAIESLGIEAKMKSGKAPDLGKVDLKDKADWIMKFLIKEADKDGKKHAVKFNGTEDELKVISTWLTTLGEPAKEGEKKAE
jgi:mono/diheme cytochrome c family protein